MNALVLSTSVAGAALSRTKPTSYTTDPLLGVSLPARSWLTRRGKEPNPRQFYYF